MTTWRDYNAEPDQNTSPPPVGAPEGNYRGDVVNNTFREVMSVVRDLGDTTLKIDEEDGSFTSESVARSMALQSKTAVNITGGAITNTKGVVPIRGVIFYSGSESQITALEADGWARCDGRTRDGITTPDLRGRFIRAFSGSLNVGDTGGDTTDTPTMITGSPALVEGGTRTPRIDTLPPYYVLIVLMRTS